MIPYLAICVLLGIAAGHLCERLQDWARQRRAIHELSERMKGRAK